MDGAAVPRRAAASRDPSRARWVGRRLTDARRGAGICDRSPRRERPEPGFVLAHHPVFAAGRSRPHRSSRRGSPSGTTPPSSRPTISPPSYVADIASGHGDVGRGLAGIRSIESVVSRSGTVLDGRYHHRLLRTPREVRSALAYVLLNARKHWFKRTGAAPPPRLDAASSAAWFDGWQRRPRAPDLGPPGVAAARTWLLRTGGWRRQGRSLAAGPRRTWLSWAARRRMPPVSRPSRFR